MKRSKYLAVLLWSCGQANADGGVGTVAPLNPPVPQAAPPSVLEKPNLPERSSPALSKQAAVFIRKIRLQGHTVFSDEQLAPIVRPYENRNLSAEDLRQLRHEVTLFYINNGYINSGAVLPEQTVQNGELLLQIVEGRLSEIKLEGLEHLREFYLTSRMQKHSEDLPLNIKTLQEDLQLVQQNPLVGRINAELTPGIRPGEAILRAKVEEARPGYLTLGGNNYGVPSVGAERFETWAGHRNVLGFGDRFDGHFNISGGQTQYDFNYAVPLNRWDTELTFRYQRSDADVIEKPFDVLKIFNQTESFALGLKQPLWQTLEDQVTLGLMLEHRNSQEFLNAFASEEDEDAKEQFSFSRGSVDGVSKVSVLRFSQEWLHRTTTEVLAARSIASWGVDALGATVHERNNKYLPDGRFFAWLGQVQWIQKLWDSGVEMHLKGNAQLSSSPLLSMEKFALGGFYSVRGYRQNHLVRENGFSSSLEFRIPVLFDGKVKLAPFFDYGRSWSVGYKDVNEPHALASAGIGLIADPIRELHLELYWASAFRNVQTSPTAKPNSDSASDSGNKMKYDDLQDDGFYFSVAYTPFD